MSTKHSISRREFLKIAGTAGTGLAIGIYLSGCQNAPAPSPTSTSPKAPPGTTHTPEPTATQESTSTPNPNASFEPNLYLRVDGTGVVTVTVPRPELGQGVRTALAMIVAEELDADWSTVRVEQAPADSRYGNQLVGGSRSIYESYYLLQKAGAIARAMLISAAALMWEVEQETCHTENGRVIHTPRGDVLTYADLAELAATLPVPRKAQIKDSRDYQIIGKSIGRLDNPQIVDGSAIYGSDVMIPGMLHATITRCPIFGGKVASFDSTQAKSVEGVHHVVEIPSGVAVVADSTWAAIKGRRALEITWNEGSKADLSTDSIRKGLIERFSSTDSADTTGSENILQAFYEVPNLAHAAQEPMNCTAEVRADSCEVWAPTQNPDSAKGRIKSISKLPDESVTVHIPLIGGGFGRRLQLDYVNEAVEISKAVGAPIKLLWTREDDIQHDYYHPFSYHLASANLDKPALPQVRSEMFGGIPTGPWRSVENFTDAFVRESFLDEMAVALGRDPYDLRLELVPENLKVTLELAASKANWSDPMPDGWGRGIACWTTFNMTPVAHVVDVSLAQDGSIRVHRVVCAIDCGTVVNPNMVKEQMEGGIVFGLTAALKANITIENGRVQQSNFHDYPLLRMDEMPTIEVYIVPSDAPPLGVGEMGVPPTAPAVANAIYAATGKRIRKLPIRSEDLKEL